MASWIRKARRAVRTLVCRLQGGHWDALHITGDRMSILCVGCKRETPGWDITPIRRSRRELRRMP